MRASPLAVAVACALAASPFLLLTSCSSKGSPADADGGAVAQEEAKAYFTSDVYPRIATACGPGCHDGSGRGYTFLAQDADGSYALIEDRVGMIAGPKKSALTTWTHSDPALKGLPAPEEMNVLRQWLAKEANARGLEGSVPPPKSLQDAYDRVSKCMSFDLFVSTGMENVALAQTDRDGPCTGCHGGGQGGVFLNAEPRFTFTKMSEFPFIQKLFVGKVDRDGNFVELVPADRLWKKGEEVCTADGGQGCHPSYGLAPSDQKAVRLFETLTLSNLAGDTCDSVFVPPIEAGIRDAGDGG